MAVVNVSFDTNSKELSVSIDGSTLEDVTYVSFYDISDENDSETKTCRMNVDMRRRDVDGIEISTSLYASDKKYTSFASADKTLVDHKVSTPLSIERLQEAINYLEK